MHGLQSILVATDFSDDAQHAAERAALLCTGIGMARGALLHVIESSWLDSFRQFVSLPAEAKPAMMHDASLKLDELAAAIRAESNVALEPKVSLGKVLDTILEVSADFDLVALGARGQRPLRDFAVGTTAERLLRQIRRPVLVVRRKPEEDYRRVLVGVDFSSHSQRAFAFANAIAPKAEIHLAHVFEVPFEGKMVYASVSPEVIEEYRAKRQREAEAEMTRFIEAAGTNARIVHRSIEHGSHAPTKLQAKATEIDADLVVVGRHGKSLAEHLLLGSVTLHVLAQCPCDVLVTQ